MKNTVLIVCFFFMVALAAAGSRHLTRELSQPTQAAQVVRPSEDFTTVRYKGIHFSFDRSLAAEVRAETIAAFVDGKPSDVVPEYPLFTLLGYPNSEVQQMRSHVRVFRVDKFREAMATASDSYARSVLGPPPPAWTINFDKEVQVLKLLLANQPQSNVGRFLGKARGEKGCGDMPFLPMWEACQAFSARVRYFDFKNGKGVFFLTQFNRETELITNEYLEYAFQGLSDDGNYYVSAEFSVEAPILPKGFEPEIVAWAEKNYLLPHTSKKYQNYLRPVVKKLEALPANQFRPNLALLEKLIESLQIEIEPHHK